MLEPVIIFLSKAFGLVWVYIFRNILQPYSDLLLLGVAVLAGYLIVKKLQIVRYAILYHSLILGVLLFLVIMKGGM